MEKVEIGGLRGRQLSGRITAVYVEFNQYFTAFASKNYDVLDPDDPTFNNDFAEFQNRILELDMKLAAILCQAFDDCYNLESVFKVKYLRFSISIFKLYRIFFSADKHRGKRFRSAENQRGIHE